MSNSLCITANKSVISFYFQTVCSENHLKESPQVLNEVILLVARGCSCASISLGKQQYVVKVVVKLIVNRFVLVSNQVSFIARQCNCYNSFNLRSVIRLFQIIVNYVLNPSSSLLVACFKQKINIILHVTSCQIPYQLHCLKQKKRGADQSSILVLNRTCVPLKFLIRFYDQVNYKWGSFNHIKHD